jgi:Membrane domain of glycerophosphoryl diester phosphodiesterase
MPEYAGMASIDYTGARLLLGRTADGYAIWDLLSGEQREVFPLTQEGWTAAWLRFRELEGEAPVAAAGEPAGAAGGNLRPLGLGGVMERTFRVYGRNLGTFALIVAVVTIPLMLLQVLVLQAVLSRELELLFSGALSRTDGALIEQALRDHLPMFLSAGVLVGVISLFVSSLVSAALVSGVLQAFRGAPGRAGELLRAGWRRMPSMALIVFLTVVIVALAAVPAGILLGLMSRGTSDRGVLLIVGLLLALPLLLLYTRYLFAPATLIAEDRRGSRALRRSWDLTRGRTWPILGTFILFGLISLVPNILVGLPFQLIAEEQESVGMFWLFVTLGGVATSVVIVPFTTAAIVHLYIDTRARKEALDPGALLPAGDAGTA